MKKKSLSGLYLVLVILLTSPIAFAQNDDLIKGTWNLTGTLPKSNGGRTFTWFLEWTFSDGNFLQTGYPPLSQKGKYRVLKNEDNKLTLELYEQSGNFGAKDKQIEIIVDKENKTLTIDGKKGFTSVKKKEEPKVASSPITDEEYAVFLAILGGKDSVGFVVGDTTEGVNGFLHRSIEDLHRSIEGLKPETAEDFNTRNKKSAKLEKKFPTQNSYTIITEEELKKFFGKGLNWEGFYKQYPKSGGIINFSRVGFSQDGQQALLFVSHSCGSLCGEGNYYFLNKENGEWKIIKKLMTWIS